MSLTLTNIKTIADYIVGLSNHLYDINPQKYSNEIMQEIARYLTYADKGVDFIGLIQDLLNS